MVGLHIPRVTNITAIIDQSVSRRAKIQSSIGKPNQSILRRAPHDIFIEETSNMEPYELLSLPSFDPIS